MREKKSLCGGSVPFSQPSYLTEVDGSSLYLHLVYMPYRAQAHARINYRLSCTPELYAPPFTDERQSLEYAEHDVHLIEQTGP